MIKFLAAIAGTIFSVAGGATVAVSSMATSVLSGAAGVASGVGGLLFGAPAGLTVSQQMAAIAQPGYYGGVDVLGGVTASAIKTVDYLGNLAPTALGIYRQIVPPTAPAPTPAGAIPPVTAPAITRPILPTLSTPAPIVMTTGAAAKPELNYLLYIGLAVLALFLLRKK